MNRTTLGLVFGYEGEATNSEDIDENLDVSEGELEEEIVKQEKKEEVELGKPRRESKPRKSAYLRVFEDVVNDIASHERELLSDEEAEVLRSFTNLSYAAMCIVTRLLQRNSDNWYSVSTMEKYKRDTGENGLLEGVNELCSKSVQDLLKANIKTESNDTSATNQSDIIDLTFDSDDEGDVKPFLNPKAGPSRLPHTGAPNRESEPYYFCLDESHMTLEQALNRLPVNSLNELAKEFKCKPPRPKKETLIGALLQHARGQTVLPTFTPDRKGKQKGKASVNGQKQLTLNCFVTASKNQESVLRQRALKKLGRCIRVNPKFYELVCRLNIIFYRSTEQPTKPFLPSLLTIFKKRLYPPYTHNRSVIWPTREEYLEYEEALICQARMSDAEIMPASDRASVARLTSESTAGPRFTTPVIPSRDATATLTTPRAAKTPTSASSSTHIKDEVGDVVLPVEVVEHNREGLTVEESDNLAMKRSKAVLTVFERERIQERWDACLATEQAKPEEERRPELERFSSGYIYTRLMYKAAAAMGPLKRYEEEFALLQKLLSQRYWRRGKRGEWYQRRALVQESYLSKRGGKKTKDKAVLAEAWEGLMEALEDDDTHLVVRPDLVRRMIRLEQTLDIPVPFQCKVARELRKPKEDTIVGKRIWVSVRLDEQLKPIAGASGSVTEKENRDETNADLTNYFQKVHAVPDKEKDGVPDVNGGAPVKPSPRWKGKSIWKGEGNTEVIVEEFALQHYAKLGFNGFHAETKILTTIFALLFWDIIFADIPGAFETKFQAAPLDLAEDSFYYARKEMIDARLKEIDNGHARSILERHDKLYRDKKTWCVGVNWDKCKREDVFEIVECLSTETLNSICRLFCEDYAARASGVPDLVLWDYEHRKCQFVEVKGPGDKASATQKLWFDTLLGAGTDVELLHVKDNTFHSVNREHNKKVRAEERAKRKAQKNEKKKGKRKKASSDDEVEEVHDACMIVDGDNDEEYQPPDPEEPVAQSPVKRRLRSTSGDAEDENGDDGNDPARAVLLESQHQSRTRSPAWPRDNVEVVVLSPPKKKRRME